NTCPVGIATQDPDLRKKFHGKPEYVINYFFFVAEELREIMARLGFRAVNEMIGRADMLEYDPLPDHWKAKLLDLSRVLRVVEPWEGETRYCSKKQDHGLDKALDNTIMKLAKPALERKARDHFRLDIRNVNRTVGTMLSSELTRRHKLGMYGDELPVDTVTIDCFGQAGQSFGAFAIQGVTLNVVGEANDYCGKGLSGGRLIFRPPQEFLDAIKERPTENKAEDHIIVGNVALYGATSGEAYFRGRAGERFCVRNSGAWAVVEGVGDHGCEYMTGGRVLVLGSTGRNFAAGMSGGIAFVYDPDGVFPERCNTGLVDMKEMQEESVDDVRDMLAMHFKRTQSTIAEYILNNFDSSVAKMVRVMPRDYARVMRERQKLDEEKFSYVPQ
ncbi:MAG: glutamate synthase-related protein, partial [Candidatus Hydrogenedentota bacterium]